METLRPAALGGSPSGQRRGRHTEGFQVRTVGCPITTGRHSLYRPVWFTHVGISSPLYQFSGPHSTRETWHIFRACTFKEKRLTSFSGGTEQEPDSSYHDLSCQWLKRIIQENSTCIWIIFSAFFTSCFPNIWTILLGKGNNEDDLREVPLLNKGVQESDKNK